MKCCKEAKNEVGYKCWLLSICSVKGMADVIVRIFKL